MNKKSIVISSFTSLIFLMMLFSVQKIYPEEPSIPPVTFAEEPELTVITGTYVYYISKDDNDIFFFEGTWWRPWHEAWYRADIYSGPWLLVNTGIVPLAIIGLPAGWRIFPHDVFRVRWGNLRRHWFGWEHERYWGRHSYGRFYGGRGSHFRQRERHRR